MTLRAKLVLALVVLASFCGLAIGVSSYVTTADRLHSEINKSLTDAASGLLSRMGHNSPDGEGSSNEPNRGGGHGPGPFGGAGSPPGFNDQNQGDGQPGGVDDFLRSFTQILVQTIDGQGTITGSPTSGQLPVTDADRTLAASSSQHVQLMRTTSLDGEPYRVLTESVGSSQGAIQVARGLSETNRLLDSIRNRTIAVVLMVTAAAVLAGWLLARQSTRRLRRLSAVASEVARTGRLDLDVPSSGRDETAQLGAAFTEMLQALQRSREAQQRLVQDAGHELRTPLTSLRTNASVLRRFEQLRPEARTRLIDDVESETRELSALVNELVELATDQQRSDEPLEEADLASIVERAAERVRRRTGRTIGVVTDNSVATVRRAALERAVTNLLENAAKFSDTPSGAAATARATPIDISLHAGRIEVCDRGPGIARDDLPHIFDRFYRATSARALPGSGLGLAIVRDVVESVGGTVFASNRDGGGACIGMTIPVL